VDEKNVDTVLQKEKGSYMIGEIKEGQKEVIII